MSKTIIYVDYENMGNLKKLVPIDGHYIFFIGSTQTSIPKSLVLATNNIKVEWVAIEGSGKNALDFHIAYFLGTKELEPETLHFILSKDTGYDPLIAFINKKSKREIAKRIISLEDLKPKSKDDKTRDMDLDYKTLFNFLNSFAKVRRPKSEAKLESFIKTQVFQKKSDAEIRKLIEELYRNKVISKGVNNRISYK